MKKILMMIAICEVVRALQNSLQLALVLSDGKARDNAYEEFVKSLKATDREYVERLLEEFEEQEDG